MESKIKTRLMHCIVPDTSILWCEDKKVAVNPEFDQFWESASTSSQIELLVPDVVRGELLFQQVTSANKSFEKAQAALKEFCSVSNQQHHIKTDANHIHEQIVRRFDDWLRKHNGKRLALPAQIDLPRLAEAAIWRLPPFTLDSKNLDNEKGFRDALILESLYHHAENSQQDSTTAFLCGDSLLLETAKKRLSHKENCVFYESVAGLSSYLRLVQERHAKEFITSIVRKASRKFYTEGDQTSLWYRDKIEQQLSEHCNEAFIVGGENRSGIEQLSTLGDWMKVTPGQWGFGPSEFVNQEGDIYHWNNVITFFQQYRFVSNKSAPTEPTSVLDLFEKLLETMQRIYSHGVLQLTFKIQWKATVTKDQRFLNTCIQGMQLHKRSFDLLTQELRKKLKIPLNPTSVESPAIPD